MTAFLVRLAAGAAAWRRVVVCEPDPDQLAAAEDEVRDWLETGPAPVRVLLESTGPGEPHALVIGCRDEPIWVPEAALVRCDGGAEALLVVPVAAFGSRVELDWLPWAIPADDSAWWIQIGIDEDHVLFRRWDPATGAADGPLLRALAVDVIDRREAPRSTEASDPVDGDVRQVLLGGDELSSAALIARFLRQPCVTEIPQALPSRSVADGLSPGPDIDAMVEEPTPDTEETTPRPELSSERIPRLPEAEDTSRDVEQLLREPPGAPARRDPPPLPVAVPPLADHNTAPAAIRFERDGVQRPVVAHEMTGSRDAAMGRDRVGGSEVPFASPAARLRPIAAEASSAAPRSSTAPRPSAAE
jgi:hypothetical protein